MRHYYIKFICLVITSLVIWGTAFAADTSKTTNINISTQSVFSLEFYTDTNVVSSDTIAFTGIDPNKSIVYPDGRQENDGKSDTAVLCKSNSGAIWYLKLHVIPTPPLAANKLRYYLDQPYNRNTGERGDGTLAESAKWLECSDKPVTVYAAGPEDMSNLPFGTLSAFNFALNPSGLNAGEAYSAEIVYTMSSTP